MSAQIPLVEAVHQYCTLNPKITSSGTRRLYGFAVRSYEKFLDRAPIVSDLNDFTFSAFIEWRGSRVANGTLCGECCKLLALWRWCAGGKRRWIDEPEVSAPEPQYRIPKAMNTAQLETLWQAAESYRMHVGGLPGYVYWPALLYTLWDTSERIGAVHQMDRRDLDVKSQWIVLEPHIRKGGRQGRAYKLRDATTNAIARLLDAHNKSQLFAVADLKSLRHAFALLRADAGLPNWVTFHSIRKSHASHLAAVGGNARTSLGHSSDTITDRHYIDPTIVGLGQQPCDMLFDPGKRKSWWKKLFGL